MTTKRIYNLAYFGCLELWDKQAEKLKNNPDNELKRIREKKAWEELEEIRKLCIAEESKNN